MDKLICHFVEMFDQLTANQFASLFDITVLLLSALVEKIYQAQKERDAAVNARLQLAYSEREELLDKLRRTEREHTGYVKCYAYLVSCQQ